MSEKNHEYAGENIVVRYASKRCIHAAKCVQGLPAVFNPQERRWVQPANAGANEIAAVVMNCPSGALQFERKDGGAAETASNENVIRTRAHGPHYVRGDIHLMNTTGEMRSQETRVALCRCGASQNKPFCDNSHERIAFQDAATWAHEVAAPSSASTAQSLSITPTPNGSLKIEGELEIYNAEGALAFRGNKTFLCRCGGSANKPFCDGSHARVGFKE